MLTCRVHRPKPQLCPKRCACLIVSLQRHLLLEALPSLYRDVFIDSKTTPVPH